jgi:pimeloyl-ACP methyl ester carboxylesterase
VSDFSVDPIAADINLYRYCGDNSTDAVDPMGLARLVFAVDGAGTAVTIPKVFELSAKSVRYTDAIGQVVADRVESKNWQYYNPVDNMNPLKGIADDVEKAAKQEITDDAGKPCYNTIVLLGFSWGGGTVYEVAKQLKKRNISVNLVTTLDPVPVPGNGILKLRPPVLPGVDPKWSKQPNVNYWINYYQKVKWQAFVGWEVTGADIDTRVTATSRNPNVVPVWAGVPGKLNAVNGLDALYDPGPQIPFAAHMSIPRLAVVLSEFRKAVSNDKIVPVTRDSYSYTGER